MPELTAATIAALRDALGTDGLLLDAGQCAVYGYDNSRRHAQPQAVALPESNEQVQALVLRGLQRHPTFFAAALPKHVSPPLFNRYAGEANSFGSHVDGAVRYLRDGAGRVRTDISCTLFLSAPDEYDGGELVIEDTYGEQRIRFAAGDLVMYPGTSVHRVSPVTRGERIGAYFWVQSMVRSDEQRRLLFDMDRHLVSLRSRHGEQDPSVIGLTGVYHNLLRGWVDT